MTDVYKCGRCGAWCQTNKDHDIIECKSATLPEPKE